MFTIYLIKNEKRKVTIKRQKFNREIIIFFFKQNKKIN